MSRFKIVFITIALAAISACTKSTVTIARDNSSVTVNGDTIATKDGQVFVNGVSFGAVPPGGIVKYENNSNGAVLFVNSERRSALN